MKKSNIVLICLAVVFFVGTTVNLYFHIYKPMQENWANPRTENIPELSNFLFLIENTANGIKITNTEGCIFTELSFSLREGQIQEIDQYGMRDPWEKIRTNNNDKYASFRIAIKKTNERLELKGIDGTAWEELNFACPVNCTQLIDQYGMR